jgi:hypothetical protein
MLNAEMPSGATSSVPVINMALSDRSRTAFGPAASATHDNSAQDNPMIKRFIRAYSLWLRQIQR